jgi:hypothetical protein
VDRKFDVETPVARCISYDQVFLARRVPAATYVFTDLDRLQPEQRELAADIYHGLGEAGLVRLNNPEKVLLRYDLLRAMHRAEINPFDAYRAEGPPHPKRFPVFMRREDGHTEPTPTLINSQLELEAALQAARYDGAALDRMIAIEFCAEPVAPGIWKRFGTFRVGDAIQVTQAVTEDSWYVKYGKAELSPDELLLDSLDAVKTNRFAEIIRPAFELANIEYGRADHALVDGRQVIYEINTNPMIEAKRKKLVRALVLERDAIVRRRFAEMLWRIDSGDARFIEFPRSDRLEKFRRRSSAFSRLATWFSR